jgi:hypothetical protein
MKTAIQWFFEQLEKDNHLTENEFLRIIQQAKEMEKEQKIAFAKLHVKSALKAASEKGEAVVRTNSQWTSSKVTASVNKASILNSYLLKNIK